MAMLLDGGWQPVTSELTFVEGNALDRVDDYNSWRGEWLLRNTGRSAEVRQISGRIDDMLSHLLPLQRQLATKWLFVPVRGGSAYRTLVLGNLSYGGDADSVRGAFSSRGCAGSVVLRSNHQDPRVSDENTGGTCMFEVHYPAPYPPGGHVRMVGVAKDDNNRWDWIDKGQALPFEEVERYAARRKVNRFEFDMLLRYAEAMGLRPTDDDFYAPDGKAWLVEEFGTFPQGQRQMTLAEARDPIGWGRQ